jgi:predicted cytidylate kinase
MRIAISGPPGSGKTTVCTLVAKTMDCESLLVGQIFRQMALERKVSLDTFGRLAEEDETIDRDLDKRMVTIAGSKKDIVLEGRLTGALLKARNISVFSVYVDASEEIRAKRIAGREHKPVDLVIQEMQKRERSERKRYLAYYGIDMSNQSIYDLWIDSGDRTAEEIASIVVAEARKRYAEDAHQVEKA